MSTLSKTKFLISKMDCPSEEKMIGMALKSVGGIELLTFALSKRELEVIHSGNLDMIKGKLEFLNLGATLLQTEEITEIEENTLALEKAKAAGKEKGEKKVLLILLAINGVMFFAEMIFGIFAQSMGLIADSMDMFADAAVYCVSLYAVGKSLSLQHKAARLSGYLQYLLATIALIEVVRRLYFGADPKPTYMIWVSLIAFIANAYCLYLIFKHREGGVHMKASLIFSANDVIANFGVILAGILVTTFNSPAPDLVIGAIISVLVFRGAYSILRLAKD